MINFIKNDFYRIKSKGYYIIISLFMIVISVTAAVYLTSKMEVKGNVALVTSDKTHVVQSQYLKITVMRQEPPKYELVLGKYDAVIVDRGNNKYDINTIKNDDFRKMLYSAIKNSKGFIPKSSDERKVGSNIVGYLLMFILIQAVLFMFLLSEDIELKQIKRIAVAPVSFIKYLLSHFICVFMLIFIPVICVLAVAKYIFEFDIGFDMIQYTVIISLSCFFGIAFTMFINALVKVTDTANMMGSSIIVLTTILSGSFYSFDKGNNILEKIIWILPQKNFLSFVQGLENKKELVTMFPQLSYVVMLSLVFFIFSIMKIKKEYVLKRN